MKKIIHCYAQTLFLISGNQLDLIRKEVESLLIFFKNYPDILMFLSNPVIPSKCKKEVLLCMKQCFNECFIKFIIVVCINRRFNLIFPILEEFLSFVRKSKNELEITIKSASLLKEPEIKIITESLSFLGKIIRVNNIIDPSIVGGFVIRYNFNLIDFSLESYLKKLVDLSKLEILKHRGFI
ncbi:ATP synthase F1 subunit delta [Wolbachia pipientis]|uniref:ATP synthase subunit delta n=1 Tax=Wolbachia pipientis TaxID=955 RepID=A0A1E7QJK6_WOLPI|nr:ATP synthase F1 subunit delta [Wolbachia pipientis]OEY86404.1 ATP synthase F1 subunit delta [Wolbachia pipientis]